MLRYTLPSLLRLLALRRYLTLRHNISHYITTQLLRPQPAIRYHAATLFRHFIINIVAGAAIHYHLRQRHCRHIRLRHD